MEQKQGLSVFWQMVLFFGGLFLLCLLLSGLRSRDNAIPRGADMTGLDTPWVER